MAIRRGGFVAMSCGIPQVFLGVSGMTLARKATPKRTWRCHHGDKQRRHATLERRLGDSVLENVAGAGPNRIIGSKFIRGGEGVPGRQSHDR